MHRVENNNESLKIRKIRNFANNKQKKKLSVNILLLHNLCKSFCAQSVNVNNKQKILKSLNACDNIVSKQLTRIFTATSPLEKIDLNFVVLLPAILSTE